MIITQTPLRVSFVGGGTDLPDFYRTYGGSVISTAIDKYIFVIVKERFDEMIYLNWSKKEIVDHIDTIEHELIREVMKKTGVTKGVEITTLSDIPSEGSGLGSSSSVTVGLLQALYLYKGISVDAEVLAKEACQIEIDILDKPIGKQDQYIASYGGFKYFNFLQDETVTVKALEFSNSFLHYLESCLMLFFTGKVRKANVVLSEQKNNVSRVANILEQMRDQSISLMQALQKGQIDYLGEALDIGWHLKKQLAGGVSSPEIDKMYQKAKKAGALGGKVAGAGGGGFLLLYVPLGKQTKVREALADYRELNFHLERDGSKSIFNIRR